jgi:uncharacterized protein (TIGR03382 family)
MIRRMSLACLALSAITLALSAGRLPAATIVVQDSLDDFETQRRSDTGVSIASENFATGSRVGHQTNFNGSGANAPGGIGSLFFFQLPALSAGQSITSATFSVGRLPDSAASAVTPTFNGDLYALGVIDSISKTAADAEKFFYLGNTAQSALPAGGPTVGGSVSRVADDFLVPADFTANGGIASATPDTADITSYVQNLYSNPGANGFTPGTSYLVMRANSDADPIPASGTQRYTLAFQGTSGNGGAGTPENRPLVTLNVVPEPASAAIAMGGLAWGALCRRRR